MPHICKIINGKGLADEIQTRLKHKISNFRIKPKLAVILVGHDPRSEVYIDFKTKACHNVGIDIETIELEEDCPEARLERIIDQFNNDKNTHGLLVQLPLPGQINEKKIIEMIDPEKDVDGFNPINVGRIMAGIGNTILPPAPKGIIRILDSLNIDLKGKDIVVVGGGYLIGRPLVNLLINYKATVTLCQRNTKDLSRYTKEADILITGVGKPNLIKKDMIKKNSIVIDAGITSTKDGVVGDVDYNEACHIAKYITPVPGGVGPMTVAMLLENTWQAMRIQNGYNSY